MFHLLALQRVCTKTLHGNTTRNFILHWDYSLANADSLPAQNCWCSIIALMLAHLQGMLHSRLRQHCGWQAAQLARQVPRQERCIEQPVHGEFHPAADALRMQTVLPVARMHQCDDGLQGMAFKTPWCRSGDSNMLTSPKAC